MAEGISSSGCVEVDSKKKPSDMEVLSFLQMVSLWTKLISRATEQQGEPGLPLSPMSAEASHPGPPWVPETVLSPVPSAAQQQAPGLGSQGEAGAAAVGWALMLWESCVSINNSMQLGAPWCYLMELSELRENGVWGQRAPDALCRALLLKLELLPTRSEVEASVPSGAFSIGSDINNELKIRWDTQGFSLALHKQGVMCSSGSVGLWLSQISWLLLISIRPLKLFKHSASFAFPKWVKRMTYFIEVLCIIVRKTQRVLLASAHPLGNCC